MKTNKFIIFAPGDPSVGISPAQWEITGDFYFDEPEIAKAFCSELASLFEDMVAGEKVRVMTQEEVEEDNKSEIEWEKKMDAIQEEVEDIKNSEIEDRIYGNPDEEQEAFNRELYG